MSAVNAQGILDMIERDQREPRRIEEGHWDAPLPAPREERA